MEIIKTVLPQALICILTILLAVVSDWSEHKDKFDDEKKRFNWRTDWWQFRNDNMLKVIILGLIGGLLSNQLGVPVIHYVIENYIPELSSDVIDSLLMNGTDLASVWIVTHVVIRYFKNKK